MTGAILMIHGIGGTGAAFDRLGPAFRGLGWRVETPTFRPDKRTAERPPADLPSLTLGDYIAACAAIAKALKAETGMEPVLMGHSLGGLVVQKLAEAGLGRAAILVTPASPADIMGKPGLSQAITFGNVLIASKPETKAHKIWPFGFSYGVLNKVDRAKHAGIFAGTVYESGKIYEAVAWPHKDPTRSSHVDESKISIPMLVIGAGQDRATPVAGVRQVAAKYKKVGADYREYPNNAHWIVDEPGTDKVIADIAEWLTGKGVTAEAPAKAAKAPVAKAPAKPAPKAKATPVAKAAAPVKVAAKAKPTAKPAPAAKAAAPAKKAAPKVVVAPRPAAKPVAKAAPAKVAPVNAAKPAPAAKAPAKAAKPVAKAAVKPVVTKPAAKAAPAKVAKPVAAKAPAVKATPAEPAAKAKAPAKAPVVAKPAAKPAAKAAPAKPVAKPAAAAKPAVAKPAAKPKAAPAKTAAKPKAGKPKT